MPHRVSLIFLLVAPLALAQLQTSGGKEYGLGSSSVGWLPRPGALFLNPAELGRLHESEFLLSTGKLRSLSSMVGTQAFPFVGTFAAGVANEGPLTNYSVGFGTLIGSYHTVGASISVLSPVPKGFRFALGGGFHLPTAGKNSGLHAGASLMNLPDKVAARGGVGYWAIADLLRIQLAVQNRIVRGGSIGVDLLAAKDLSVVVGSQGFKKFAGGVSYQTPAFSVDLASGPQGLSFSMNFIVGESAEDKGIDEYDEGIDAYTEGRYSEARNNFLTALEYDEYDNDSRSLASEMSRILDSTVTVSLQQAHAFEERKNFPAAMRAYAKVFRADPERSGTESQITDARKKLDAYVAQLIASGDSLRARKDIPRARKNFDLALELDPQNEQASARVDELENLSKENVKVIIDRGRSLLNKNQLDDAQKEYERALIVEPKNAQARAGLNTVAARRGNARIDEAKAAFTAGNYFDALGKFLDLARRNEKNKEVASFIDQCRAQLLADADKYFKAGLQQYVKEDYKTAIETWDNALMIQPRHAATLEYRKRAEEKMKALEQLK